MLTSIIKAAQLPGEPISNYNSTANVKASAAFRMDENLTCFAVSGVAVDQCGDGWVVDGMVVGGDGWCGLGRMGVCVGRGARHVVQRVLACVLRARQQAEVSTAQHCPLHPPSLPCRT